MRSMKKKFKGCFAVLVFAICLVLLQPNVARAETILSGNSAPSEDTTAPISTSEFIMVGGNWVTPVATYGRSVNVVLPVVNMSTTPLSNVIITPVIGTNTADWPFEIQQSSYTQTIADLPAKGNGQSDMDRRRELTWTFQTRKDVLNGYYKVPFQMIYYVNGNYETTTITTYVKVIGAPGSGNVADGGSALSTPRVIITGFSTTPEQVYAGDTFTLTLHLHNTSKRTAVSNMEINLSAPKEGTDSSSTYEAFLPTSGSNTLFLEKIGVDGTADIQIELTAKADLTQKPYPIGVRMDYEDEQYKSYGADANVSIPVKQESKFDTSTIEAMPMDLMVGGQSNVMFSIFNTGKSVLYNVQVKFAGDSITGGDAFIGKIDVGATGNVDAMITGMAPTMDDGTVKAVISYEDDAGNVSTKEVDFTLFVNEDMNVGMDDSMMEDMYMEEEPSSPVGVIITIIVIILLAAGAAVFFIMKKKKKAKLAEEDLMDIEDDMPDVETVDQDEVDYEENEE